MSEYLPLRLRANGEALTEYAMTWTGAHTKQLIGPARITERRVECRTKTFDRETGKRVSAFNPHLRAETLLAYRFSGETEWTFMPGILDV